MPVVCGYKADGDARLFDLGPGASLPSGWYDDLSVIADLAKRSGEAISAACGGAGATPIVIAAADRAEVVPSLPAAVKYDHAGPMREVWAKRKVHAEREKANDAI